MAVYEIINILLVKMTTFLVKIKQSYGKYEHERLTKPESLFAAV